MKQLTVKELIERLEKLPQDALVWSDGCDCYGEAVGAVLMEDGSVIVRRSEGAYYFSGRGREK